MALPQLSTKATNFTVTPQLETLLDQKLEPLEKFLEGKGDVKCAVEFEKIGDHHSGKIFRAEINLYVDGKMFRAEATEELMEHAIDEARNELKRELQTAQAKKQSLMRRGGQAIKDMLRFGR